MSVGITLVLLSSLAWAVLDALRKRLATSFTPAALVALLSLGQAPLFALWWLRDGVAPISVSYLGIGGLTLVLNLGANYLFVSALARGELSATVPLLSLTPAMSSVMGVFVLNQRPDALSWIGIVSVVIGACLSAIAERSTRASATASWMMLGVATMWASTTVLDARATAIHGVPFHAFVQTFGTGAVLAAIHLVARRSPSTKVAFGGTSRARCGTLVLAIVVASAAYAGQLHALAFVDAGLLETVKRVIGILAALVVGVFVLRERVPRRRVLGVALMLLGTVAVLGGLS